MRPKRVRARRWLLPFAVMAVGVACVWVGLADRDRAPASEPRAVDALVEVQRSYEVRARLVPVPPSRVRGIVTVTPDPADPGRSIVELLLDNDDPELARFHADVRRGTCPSRNAAASADRFQLEPIDDGATSRTVLDAPTSSLATGRYAVVVQSVDESTVHACARVVPAEPALAAATGNVTSADRSCSRYLDGLSEVDVRSLEPADLPAGLCRVQAETLLARSTSRTLRIADYQADLAQRTLLGLRDCLVDAGLQVPLLETTSDGLVAIHLGLAMRDPAWKRTIARCDRAHPVPDPS